METTIKPYGSRIVIKRLPEQEISKGGIIIPDQAQEKPRYGTVLAVGEPVKTIKIGDIVVFGKYSGLEIKDDLEDILILKTEDVHGFKSS